jgi:hypothetical protein
METNLSEETQFDIRIGSNDPSIVGPIERAVQELSPRRLEQHRDIGTILVVASSAVSIVKGLIEIWKELKALHHPTSVTVEAPSGAQLDLNAVKSEEEIQRFVAEPG